MHTPPKTPDLNSEEAPVSGTPPPDMNLNSGEESPQNLHSQSQQNSQISGLSGTSDQFSTISTHTSELDDDNFAEGKELMKIDGKGCFGFLERIPLPLKLMQLSLFAAVGMIVLAILIIILRASTLSAAQQLNYIFKLQNKLYDGLDQMYDSRYATVMFHGTKSPTWNVTRLAYRQKTTTGLGNIVADTAFDSVPRAYASKQLLKQCLVELTPLRSRLDALALIPNTTEADFDLIQELDDLTIRMINAVTEMGSAMSDDLDFKSIYMLALIQKMRSAVEYMHNHMTMLLTLGIKSKQLQDNVKLAVQMDAIFDKSEEYLDNEMDDIINADYKKLVKDTDAYKRVKAMAQNVTNTLVAGLSVPSLSLNTWSNASETLVAQMQAFEKKWQQIYVNEAQTELTNSIVYIVLLLVFIVACFIGVCANSFFMSRTITGPWQRMNYLLEQSISKFVPKDFLYLIHCNSVTDVKLGKAEKCDLTVLSLDVKYSVIHEDNSKPDHVIQVLNQIFSFIGPIIRLHHGYIEKYLSNGCECVFTHPKKAVFAALDLEKSIDSFNNSKKNVQILSMVIGIHSEKNTVIGTIGESQRMESAIVSPTVKIAHGIKNLAKKLKSKVLISRDTLGHVKKSWSKVQYRFLGTHSIETESSTFPIRVYELFSDSDSRVKHAKEFSKAVGLMDEGRVDEALRVFKIISTNNPSDASAAQFQFLCSVLIEESTSESKNIEIRPTLMEQELREAFKKQLVQEYCHENILLWEKVVEALNIADPVKQREQATKVCDEFFAVNAKYQMNFSQQLIQQFRDAIMDTNIPWSNNLLMALQAEAENLMIDSFKRFKNTPACKAFLAKNKFHNPAVKV